MSTKVINDIQTQLDGDEIGSMIINWDMEYYFDYDQFDNHVRTDEVKKINSIELQIFDKVGFDITEQILADKHLTAFLENKLLNEIEYMELSEIGGQEFKRPESEVSKMIGNIAREEALTRFDLTIKS